MHTKYEREENIGDIVALCDFDEQPTAYDVDKVIEQIEYRRANFDCKLCKYNDDKYPYGKPQTDEVARGSGTESMAVGD